jgi:small subunit ribosomal protein S15
MPLSQAEKAKVIEQFGKNAKDAGRTEVQIAMLTKRINYLTDHSKNNPKDFNSRRGLLQLVGQRRRLLDYMKKKDIEKYRNLIKELGIRR